MANALCGDVKQSLSPSTKKQLLILEIAQLLPCLVAWGVLKLTNDGIITLLGFFLILVGAPIAYCRYFKKDMRAFIVTGLDNRKQQVKEGVLACIGIVAMMMGAYYAFWNLDVRNQAFILSLNIPLKRNLTTTVLFFMIFSFINPVLEEFFWRVFLAKNFKGGEIYNILVTFHYALYHVFVVQYITRSWLLSLVAFVGIFGLGRFLVHLRDKNGLIVGTIAHLGADLGVALMYCHVFSQYVLTN